MYMYIYVYWFNFLSKDNLKIKSFVSTVFAVKEMYNASLIYNRAQQINFTAKAEYHTKIETDNLLLNPITKYMNQYSSCVYMYVHVHVPLTRAR